MDVHHIRAVVTAAREVTHATANLAAVSAALHARNDGGRDAVEASMGAAKAAFVLDDIYRRMNGSNESLEATLASLEAAEEAVRAAREAIRTAPALRTVVARDVDVSA